MPVSFFCLGGERGLGLGDEGGVVEAGGLAEGGGDGAVDAAHPDLRVGQVDQGVAGGVQAGHGGAGGCRLAAADFAGQRAKAAGGDEPAQPGDGFFVRGGGIQGFHGDGRAERHAGEAVVGLQVRDHRCSFRAEARRCPWRGSGAGGGSAVGGFDGVSDQGDVAGVEAAEVVPEVDGDAGIGEAGGDPQDGPLGAGAGQLPGIQGADGRLPPDHRQRLPGGDGATPAAIMRRNAG